jgi:hypothetical protein
VEGIEVEVIEWPKAGPPDTMRLSAASRPGVLALLVERVSGRAFVEESRLHGEAPSLAVSAC